MVTVSTYIHRRMRTGRTHGMSLSSLIRRWKVIECGAQPPLPCWSAPIAVPDCREMLIANILYWRNISIMHSFVLLAIHFSSNIWGNIWTLFCTNATGFLPCLCTREKYVMTLTYPQLAAWDITSSVYCIVLIFWWFQWNCWLCIWPRRLRLYW